MGGQNLQMFRTRLTTVCIVGGGGKHIGLDLDQKVQLHTESLFLFWTVILCINKHLKLHGLQGKSKSSQKQQKKKTTPKLSEI